MNINPFATDPSLSQYTNSGVNAAGSTPSFNVDGTDSFDSFLSSEMASMQSSITMAMDKLNSPIHNIQSLLDKIKSGQPIANTESVSNELYMVANELMASINSTSVPDQSKLVALGDVIHGLSSLVERYGSKDALERLTELYGSFDLNSLGHQQIKVEFVRWTRIEIFRFNGSSSSDSETQKADNLDKTQQLQSLLVSFVESIKDLEIAEPLIPFFNTSIYLDHACEKYPIEIDEANEAIDEIVETIDEEVSEDETV